jgi:hypothetical protein
MHGLLTAAWSKITSSEVLVSRPSAVPRPIWTSVASPAQEHEWHHHILVLAILTVVMSLIAIVVAVATSGKSGFVEATSAENVEVWADDHTGRYSCPDSARYGKTRKGRYLPEKEARFAGFRPADGVEKLFSGRFNDEVRS